MPSRLLCEFASPEPGGAGILDKDGRSTLVDYRCAQRERRGLIPAPCRFRVRVDSQGQEKIIPLEGDKPEAAGTPRCPPYPLPPSH